MEPDPTVTALRDALIAKPYHQGMAISAFSSWVPVRRALEEYHSGGPADEHRVIFYAHSTSAGRASGYVRTRSSEDCYDDLRQTVLTTLNKSFEEAFVLNPYRAAIPAVPGLLVMRRHYEHRTPNEDKQHEIAITGLDPLLEYGRQLIKARQSMTQSLSDPWAPFILPHWTTPTTLYFLLDRSTHSYLQIEGAGQEPIVAGEQVDKIDFHPDQVSALADTVITRLKDKIGRPLGHKCRWSVPEIVANPVKDAFEEFNRALREVNTRLLTLSPWHLRKLTTEDYAQLVQQDIEGHRWLRNTFNLGQPEWLKPVEARLFVYIEKSLPTWDNEIIAHVVFPSTTPNDVIKVTLDADPNAYTELLRTLRKEETSLLHASSSMSDFWCEGRKMDQFANPGKEGPQLRNGLLWHCKS